VSPRTVTYLQHPLDEIPDCFTEINFRAPFHRPLDHSLILNTCTIPINLPALSVLCAFVVPLPALSRHHFQHGRVLLIGMWLNSYLYGNQLSGAIPSTIGSLTNLLALYESAAYFSICVANIGFLLLGLSPCRKAQGTQRNGCDSLLVSAIWKVINSRGPFHRPSDRSPVFKFCTTATVSSSSPGHSPQKPNSSFFSNISYSNQLSGTIPSTIGSLTNLQELYEHQSQPLVTKSGRLSSDYSVYSRRNH